MSNQNAQVLDGGDFNSGDKEWSHMQVPHGVQKRQSLRQLLDIIGEHCLTQVVIISRRNDKTIDLLFTKAPSPVNRVKRMHPNGQADHDIVYIEHDIKAKRINRHHARSISINAQTWSALNTIWPNLRIRTFLKTTVTFQLRTCGSNSKQAL